jgi:hypothetical protein
MHDEPEIFFEAETDAFTQPTQLNNLPAFNATDWWRGRTEEKRRREPYALERLLENALLQGFDVNDDVGQFRHRMGRLAVWIGSSQVPTGARRFIGC